MHLSRFGRAERGQASRREAMEAASAKLLASKGISAQMLLSSERVSKQTKLISSNQVKS